MADLLKPKEIVLKDIDGEEITFVISRIPATPAREIITQYPITAMPKMGNYKTNEELMLKLMNYIEVVKGDAHIRLSNQTLIDNHIPDAETLIKLEVTMIDYNTNFLKVANLSQKLGGFNATIQQLITQTLTRFAVSLSQSGKPHSKSSEKK